MPSWWHTPQIRNRVILVTVMLAVLLGILLATWAALLPFFLGAIAAYLLLPAINFLDDHSLKFMRQRHISRPLAILITYIVVGAAITGLLSYFIPVVGQQAAILARRAPSLWEDIESLLTVDVQQLLDRVPPNFAEGVDAGIQDALTTLSSALQTGIEVTLRTISQTVSFIVGLVMVPFWLFYVLNDTEEMERGFFQMIPKEAKDDVRCVLTIIDDLLSAYLRGQVILCLLVGLAATLVLVAFGLEDMALLLGTVAGITEVIPILGPYMGAIPAVLVALVDRPHLAIWVALSFAMIQQIENSFLVPRITGHAVRFHPALVMIIVVVGADVGGLWGLLLAVPLAATVRDVYRYLYLRTTERGATPEMALDALRAQIP